MTPLLEFACTEEALEKLEATLAAAPPVPSQQRLTALLPLAWQLRQRDTKRALVLADEAEACFAVSDLLAEEQRGMAARLDLIRGEAKWLFGELDAGLALAEHALRDFTACKDAIGCADAHWLLAYIFGGHGDVLRRDAEIAKVANALNSDPERSMIAQAMLSSMIAVRDVAAAQQAWAAHFPPSSAEMHPAVAAWIEGFFAVTAVLNSEHVQAIRHYGNCYTLALASGQVRRAIFAAVSQGDAFNMLNDHNAALEWLQRGLDLAQSCAWPSTTGVVLRQTAETMRLSQRFEAARELLGEAMTLMKPISLSHDYAVALGYLGDLELDLQHFEDALATFQLLERRANMLGGNTLMCNALRGQARALLQLAQPQPALRKAHIVLAIAKSNANQQIEALRVLADIYSRHPLPPPPGMRAASAPLHYLQQAHDLATSVTGFTIPGELLESLADEHAKIGDFAQAYQLSTQAIAAHAKIHSNEAANRASAMQISHETQKAWAEGEQHRKLAAAHAARADALEQANSTLEELGAVGRDITANLETHAIFNAIDTHVHALLDATTFGIYQLQPDGQNLRMVYGVEAGQSLSSYTLRLDDQERPAARCAREMNTLVIERPPGSASRIPDTLDTLSLMFAPLLVGARLLGVLTIQTLRPNAYHAREIAIFRTLTAYAAIALANAESQAQVVQHEKMASLGQLVANVAHEINTPIAAVKSSGASIADVLGRLLMNMPRLYQVLDEDQRLLFRELVKQAKTQTALLSSREERNLSKQTAEQLSSLGIAKARQKADVLVQLRAHSNPTRYLPLLQHPDSSFILDTAQGVATIIHSTANINTAVRRVSKIVFALKAFVRMDQNGEMMAFRLQDGLETVLTIHYNQIKNGITLVQNYEDIAPLRCLPDELNQVWSNLISNALHAMQAIPQQGRLTIGIRREGNMAVVSIGDNGCGIPQAMQSRIFEPFFTTKPTGEGSGLGLDIAKKIVAKHAGKIEVQSEVGVGTTFSVYLPYS